MSEGAPTIRSGEQLAYFTPNTNRPNIFSCEDMNKLVAVCNAVLNCRQWRISENGILFSLGGAGGNSVKMFKITTLAGSLDYVMAKTWDGTTLGTTEIAIAKKINYRPLITTQIILGTTITYVWADDNHRTSSDGVNPTQSEELYFPYEVDSGDTNGILLATKLDTPTGVVDSGGTDIYWIELEDRVWAKYA